MAVGDIFIRKTANSDRLLDDPERTAGFAHDRIVPFKDAIKELAGWHAFSDSGNAVPAPPDLPSHEVQPPATNPLRGIGRNDPCPCGSGKKYKKCCLQ